MQVARIQGNNGWWVSSVTLCLTVFAYALSVKQKHQDQPSIITHDHSKQTEVPVIPLEVSEQLGERSIAGSVEFFMDDAGAIPPLPDTEAQSLIAPDAEEFDGSLSLEGSMPLNEVANDPVSESSDSDSDEGGALSSGFEHEMQCVAMVRFSLWGRTKWNLTVLRRPSAYRLVWLRNFVHPIYDFASDDFTNDGLHDLVVCTMFGLHLMQSDLRAARDKVVRRLKLVAEITKLEKEIEEAKKTRMNKKAAS
jgi:hypothetical protein